jgi:hypothetical protein
LAAVVASSKLASSELASSELASSELASSELASSELVRALESLKSPVRALQSNSSGRSS